MTMSATTMSATATASTDQGILKQHQALLNAGQFLVQRCKACAKFIYFPREICPYCGAGHAQGALEFVAPGGLGVVYSTTVVRRKPDAGGDYNVALVELDEGVRLMSQVVNVPPGEVKIGLRVKARMVVADATGRVVFDVISNGEAA